MIATDFFRSLSLAEDLSAPDRFAHYRPTRRALPIIDAIASPGSNMVIAPYGSGKSLAAGVAAMHVRNGASDRGPLGSILPRLSEVDAARAARFRDRAASASSGLIIVLTGHVHDPLAAIAAAAGMDGLAMSLDGLAPALKKGGWDHVCVIWDEFGRHLEGLVGEGRSDELDVVQRLAERASRGSTPTISFTLLLHQNLLAYATRLSEATQTEWRKVEGRFRPLRMVEDSQEIYRLVADVVSALRPAGGAAAKAMPASLVEGVVAAKWLDGMDERKAVARVLSSAWPLTPGALQVLPMLVARVGQNERSLFSFLQEADLSRAVSIETVYCAFSDAMRTDVGIGGCYRRWLETESARSRAQGGIQREALAAACLLQLGAAGERSRLPRRILELALAGPAKSGGDVGRAIDELIAAKLLIWRRHNDDVAVWHGADIDVAHRVREERERRAASFDLKKFLEAKFPASYLRAPRHNAHFGVNRFFAGRYLTAQEVLDGVAAERGEQDAVIVYVIARDRAELKAVRKAVASLRAPLTISVLPHRPLEAEGAALELVSLEALKADDAFVASDPMVLTEIHELESVAFGRLAALMRNLLDPRASAAAWFAEGRFIEVTADRPGTVAASSLFDRWFARTPRIANEQLMRSHASRTMQTARVRVVGAILERGDRERLGYDAGDRSAEGSIHRTVIERTGLHLSAARRFADVADLTDPGLRAVWSILADFFGTPTERGSRKGIDGLVAQLGSAPIGLPRGVMPLVVAAGFKRFGRAVAVYRDGAYVPDMLGFAFDQMVTAPQGFSIRVERADIPLTDYLREVCYAFVHEHPAANDELIAAASDAIERWKLSLPDGARRTQKLSGPAKALLKAVSSPSDPVDMLLIGLPAAFGLEVADGRVVTAIVRARKDIDRLHDAFAQEAVALVEAAFRLPGAASSSLLAAARAWAACFDAAELESRPDLRMSDKAVLRKAVETANGRFSPKSFAGALSSILLQRGLDKWDDRTAAQFRTALREARERIEAAALDTQRPRPELRPVVLARIADLNSLLARFEGEPERTERDVMNSRSAR